MNKIIIFLIIFFALLAVVVAGLHMFTPQDNWICENGQWASNGNPVAPMPSTPCGPATTTASGGSATGTDITIASPRDNAVISSPLNVTGQARGSWYFEGSFPLSLLDATGSVLASGIGQAQGDWTTDNFVPFTASLVFDVTATTTGELIAKNDNPSGKPDLEQTLHVPVTIVPSGQPVSIVVYFGNSNGTSSAPDCSVVNPVTRTVPDTPAIGRAALEQLLAGPTADEKQSGYFTSINPGVKINSLSIANGTAKVDFDETLERAVAGSCRVTAIRAQITQTLEQFPTVDNVIISINGRTADILQP